MSLSTLYPTIRPSLLLDFVNRRRLDSRVTFTRASSATYFDQLGVLQSASNDVPRFDYDPSTLAARGLLIEEQRTNSIRNNTMQGAVAGTPGTMPTNWVGWTSLVQGLQYSIAGVGTDSGISYVDISVSGTFSGTPGATSATPTFEGPIVVAAAVGQTWTQSLYIKLVSGSLSGVELTQRMLEISSAGTGLTSGTSAAISVTLGALSSGRTIYTRTLAQSLTAFVQPLFRFVYTANQAYSFTLRIGLPQLEQGAFATSVIPTTTTAVTRAADVASVNTLSPWFNAAESTLYLEFVLVGVKSSGGQPLLEIDNGTSNERMRMLATASNQMQNVTTVSNVTSGNSSTPVTIYAANTTYKIAVAIKLDDMQSFVGGVAGTIDTTTLLPVGLTTLRFAANAIVGTASNVWFRRFTYYPRRLSAAEATAITA